MQLQPDWYSEQQSEVLLQAVAMVQSLLLLLFVLLLVVAFLMPKLQQAAMGLPVQLQTVFQSSCKLPDHCCTELGLR